MQEEVLEYLYQRYDLHIITNGFQEVQHVKLSNSNIGEYFNLVLTSEILRYAEYSPILEIGRAHV